MEEKLTEIFSNRISKKDLDYLERHNIKPSSYMHPSIKRDRELEKKNTKQKKMQDHSRNIIYIGLGVFFIFYSFSTTTFFAWLISFLLGVFFLVTGLLDILMEIMKKIKVERKFGRTKSE